MSAGKYSFTIEQGATLQFEIQYKDSTNSPVDLSTYNGRMQVRPTVGSSEVYLTLSSTLQSDGTGLNFSGSNGSTPPISGSIGIYISAATSSNLGAPANPPVWQAPQYWATASSVDSSGAAGSSPATATEPIGLSVSALFALNTATSR